MPRDVSTDVSPGSRRDFLKKGATTVSAAALVAGMPSGRLFAGGSDELRVGVIGCGGRGTGAAFNCVESSDNVKIVAVGEMFPDRLASARENLARLGEKAAIDDDHCFVGFDAYKKVLALADVDMVILATPPGFRPTHLKAAVAAGKHVFTEKPVAVDPTGIRMCMEAAVEAKRKNLGIVAGTQRRHQGSYLETMKRIHDGAIGEVVGGQCYWNQGALWSKQQTAGMTDMEWHLRNWLYFAWLSGDHIVEQHIHNIDVMNWAMGGPPVKAVGMGGRQTRVAPEFGHIFDHFAIEYEYANGVRIMSMCRQAAGAASRVGERIVGSLGTSNGNGRIDGPNKFRYRGKDKPYVQEHTDLIASIRNGRPLNELKRVAESTLTAIMGRMSAYTGKEVKLEWAINDSKLDLMPSELAMGNVPMPPVAVPGTTRLV